MKAVVHRKGHLVDDTRFMIAVVHVQGIIVDVGRAVTLPAELSGGVLHKQTFEPMS